MTTMFLIPAPGLAVRDPQTKEPLPESGARKPRTRYWLRRVAEGSCSEAPAPAKKTTRKKSED